MKDAMKPAPLAEMKPFLHRTQERWGIKAIPGSVSSELGPIQAPIKDAHAETHADLVSDTMIGLW